MPVSHPIDRATQVAALSIAIAIAVTGLKFAAYAMTPSVAIFSDALESIVNVVTATAALIAIRVSTRPADQDHPFGHHKAEYFAAVLEGALIIVAALTILVEALEAVRNPHALAGASLALWVVAASAAINAAWGSYLVSRGRAWLSPALVADGWHALTDVWTSVAVIAGLVVAAMTGWRWIDPALAALVAAHILWIGYRLTAGSLSGLLDEAVSPQVQDQINLAIKENGGGALQVHDIRTRHAGRASFIEFHLVVPGRMSVRESHTICDRIEAAIEAAIPGADVLIHVEPDHKAKDTGAVEI